MSKAIKGLIFDMDGLLFDTEEIYCTANLALAPDFGLEGYTKDYYFQYVGVSDEETQAAYYQDFPQVERSVIDEFMAAGHVKVREMFQAGLAPLKPGAQDLLDYLAIEKIPAIVASSNNREFVDLLLAKGGVKDYFVGSISGEDVKRAKPDPEIVEKAVAQLNLVAADCLMLEDSFNGIRAAHSAGVPVIMVPDLLAPTTEMLEKSLAVVDSLTDVKDYLAK